MAEDQRGYRAAAPPPTTRCAQGRNPNCAALGQAPAIVQARPAAAAALAVSAYFQTWWHSFCPPAFVCASVL